MVDRDGEDLAARAPAKRGYWTRERRAEIVAASFEPGASINEVAERFGIRANLLTSWRRRHARARLSATGKAARFAAVQIKAVAADGTIEIDQANRIVRVHGRVDAGMLREVLAATR
jgi:transposase